MIQAIAIDDEPYALKVLEDHASKTSLINLVKTFTDPVQGIDFFKSNAVPVLFLDIKMQDISGLEIAALIAPDSKLIFTTAYPDYA